MQCDQPGLSRGQLGETECRGEIVKVAAGGTVKEQPGEELEPEQGGWVVKILPVWGAGAG